MSCNHVYNLIFFWLNIYFVFFVLVDGRLLLKRWSQMNTTQTHLQRSISINAVLLQGSDSFPNVFCLQLQGVFAFSDVFFLINKCPKYIISLLQIILYASQYNSLSWGNSIIRQFISSIHATSLTPTWSNRHLPLKAEFDTLPTKKAELLLLTCIFKKKGKASQLLVFQAHSVAAFWIYYYNKNIYWGCSFREILNHLFYFYFSSLIHLNAQTLGSRTTVLTT